MGFFSRTLIGAGAGAALGGMSDNGSALGGAIGGAAAGGLGMWGARKIAGSKGWSVAGGMQGAFGYAARGTAFGAGKLAGLAGGRAGRAAGYGVVGANKLGRGFNTATNWIGQHANGVNKWGGRALAGLGVGSAAMIGSSIIGSNQGY